MLGIVFFINSHSFPKQSRARGYRTGAQSIGSGSFVVVELTSEDYDTQNELDIATNKGRFTAKSPGYYAVSAACQIAVDQDNMTVGISIHKNGSAHSQALYHSGVASALQPAISDVVYLDGSTDYLDLRMYHDRGAGLNTGGTTSEVYMVVHKIN